MVKSKIIIMTNKKQLKITKLFRAAPRQPEEDCDDLEEEVLKLEETRQQKRDLFFELQRNKFKCSRAPAKSVSEVFVNPQKIVLTNSVEGMKHKIELMSMLSGMEVRSYEADEHCEVVYHLQHDNAKEVKHGVMIKMMNGSNEVSNSSLPLGFNLTAVLDSFDNVLQSDCLLSIRKALVAYYDRLGQCEEIKKKLNMETQFFNSLDGSHVEMTFTLHNENEEEPEPIGVTIMFDYRVYDIRPKNYSFIELDLPEEAVNMLRLQCTVFKKKPLVEAFREAFVDGNGAFVIVTEGSAQPQPMQRKRRKLKPFRPPNPAYNNDDTFRPEDCSESDDDDVDDK